MNTRNDDRLTELLDHLGALEPEQRALLRQALDVSLGRSATPRWRRPSRRALAMVASLALLVVGMTTAWAVADGNRATSDLLDNGVVIPYDGYLTFDGQPVSDTRLVTFELWDDPSSSDAGSHLIWSETQSVELFNGRFSATLGTGTQTSATSLSDAVLDGDQLYIGIQVQNVEGDWIPLSGRQAIEPMPYAAWSANAADFKVARNLTVSGSTSLAGPTAFGSPASFGSTTTVSGAATFQSTAAVTGKVTADYFDGELYPTYSNWRDPSPQYYNLANGGGAGIVNDGNSHKMLMVVGNRSAGGTRKVGMWDDVHVNGTLTASSLGSFPAGGYCILANNTAGTCPAGFNSGYVRFDTEDDSNGDGFSGSTGGIYDGSNSSIIVRTCCK